MLGFRGEDGPKGFRGLPGPAGPRGFPGENGKSIPVSVGEKDCHLKNEILTLLMCVRSNRVS